MTLTRPSPGDPLSSSNGKSSTEILDEAFDLVDAHEAMLVGPAFVSAASQTPVTSESTLLATTSTAPWFYVNNSSTPVIGGNPATVVYIDMRVGASNNVAKTSLVGANLPAPVAVGSHSYISIEYGNNTVLDVAPENFWEWVVADGPSFTGNIVTYPMPVTTRQVLLKIYLPVYTLANIRSMGIRTRADAIQPTTGNFTNNNMFRNWNWATQTELDVALGGASTAAVLVPATYTGTGVQRSSAIPASKTMLDVRPGHETISNLDGVKTSRQFHIPEDGTEVSDAVSLALASLSRGQTLRMSKGVKYPCSVIRMNGLTEVTLDGNDCTFYRTTPGVSGVRIDECTDVEVKDCSFVHSELTEVHLADQLTLRGGATKNTSLHTVTLTNDGDGCYINDGVWHRDENGDVVIEVQAAQSGSATQDLMVDFEDIDAPPPITSVVVSNNGPMAPGTYFYRCSYVALDGTETGMGAPVKVVLPTWGRVSFSVGANTVRVYRTKAVSPTGCVGYMYDSYRPLATVYGGTYYDSMAYGTGDPRTAGIGVNPMTFTATNAGAGNIPPGVYRYFVTTVDTAGKETAVGVDAWTEYGKAVTTTGSVTLANLPVGGAIAKRRIYRAPGYASWSAFSVFDSALVAEIADGTTATYLDNIAATQTGQRVPWTGYDGNDVYPSVHAELQAKVTLTSTPTLYTLKIRPRDMSFLYDRFRPIWRKGSTTANVITMYQTQHRTQRPPFVDGWSVGVGENNAGVTIRNVRVEGYAGDHSNVSGNRVSDIRFIDCDSISNARQGISCVAGGNILYDGCRVINAGRSALDIEPYGFVAMGCRDVTVRNTELQAGTSGGGAIANTTFVNGLVLDNVRVRRGAVQCGGVNVKIYNLYAPTSGVDLTVANANIDGVECRGFHLYNGSGTDGAGLQKWVTAASAVKNVRITPSTLTSPFIVDVPGCSISNISFHGGWDASGTSLQEGPFQSSYGTSPKVTLLDPGIWSDRFPVNYPPGSVIAGPLFYPSGQEMYQQPIVNSRGISSTAVKANNLRISANVSAGASSVTIPFPTRAYANPSVPTIRALQVSAGAQNRTYIPTGTLAAATYFYRLAGRPAIGGPVVALAQQSVVVGGANNAVEFEIRGIRTSTAMLEGLTLYRGTATNTYNTRFDIVPTRAIASMNVSESLGAHYILDLGSQVTPYWGGIDWANPHNVGPDPNGYADFNNLTPTTNFAGTASLSGSNWVPVNETGYEADLNYTVTTDVSWPTTVGVTKTVAGVTLTFGVPCPVGGGAASCMIGR